MRGRVLSRYRPPGYQSKASGLVQLGSVHDRGEIAAMRFKREFAIEFALGQAGAAAVEADQLASFSQPSKERLVDWNQVIQRERLDEARAHEQWWTLTLDAVGDAYTILGRAVPNDTIHGRKYEGSVRAGVRPRTR